MTGEQARGAATAGKEKMQLLVDVGNTCIKVGRQVNSQATAEDLEVVAALHVDDLSGSDFPIALDDQPAVWHVVSVCQPTADMLQTMIQRHRPADQWRQLTRDDLPLQVNVDRPDRVGMDRLAAAVGANLLRRPGEAVVVVDAGTAITVDVLDRQGVFQGGVIMAGMQVALNALTHQTAQLPHVEAVFAEGEIPSLIGKDTVAAMRAGVYWGTLGSLSCVAGRLLNELGDPVRLMLTGGAMRWWLAQLEQPGDYVPHLVLRGVAASLQRFPI